MTAEQKPEEVEIRKAPKLLAFIITGILLGAVAAVFFYIAIPPENRSSENVLGLLFVTLCSAGMGFGILTSVAIDLVSQRRVKRALANRVSE
jgi:predicted MFS family arabinose efflux permease